MPRRVLSSLVLVLLSTNAGAVESKSDLPLQPSLELLEYMGGLAESPDGLIGPEVFAEEAELREARQKWMRKL